MKRKKAKTPTRLKKISLAPLNFEEALTAILAIPPPPKEKKSTLKHKTAK
jgi:hypothetical protein